MDQRARLLILPNSVAATRRDDRRMRVAAVDSARFEIARSWVRRSQSAATDNCKTITDLS